MCLVEDTGGELHRLPGRSRRRCLRLGGLDGLPLKREAAQVQRLRGVIEVKAHRLNPRLRR